MKRPSKPVKAQATACADANIALAKYWGKRDPKLNLPVNSSLSISLRGHGTTTTIAPADQDAFTLNGADDGVSAAQRLFGWIDRVVGCDRPRLAVVSNNTIATSAGLASSASGFAAATLALNDLFGWHLDPVQLSIVARLGSGSASRSITPGFVVWHKGCRDDGSDSFAEALNDHWPAFTISIVTVDAQPKAVSSTRGMQHTVQTSPLYAAWPGFAERCVSQLMDAIAQRDIERVGMIAESNANAMHATMHSAYPALNFWQPETLRIMSTVAQLRALGHGIFYTMDAGPNVKLIALESERSTIKKRFPNALTIAPFDH